MFSPINNLSDGRYAAALGADIIGFSLNPTDPNYLHAAAVKGIAQWLSGPELMAELAPGQGWKEASDVLEILGLNLVLIQAEQAEEMNAHRIPFVLRVQQDSFLDVYHRLSSWDCCKALLMVSENIEKQGSVATQNKIPVYIHLPAINQGVVSWMLEHKPDGIALSGENEEKPGYRDFESVNDFFDQLEVSSEASASDTA